MGKPVLNFIKSQAQQMCVGACATPCTLIKKSVCVHIHAAALRPYKTWVWCAVLCKGSCKLSTCISLLLELARICYRDAFAVACEGWVPWAGSWDVFWVYFALPSAPVLVGVLLACWKPRTCPIFEVAFKQMLTFNVFCCKSFSRFSFFKKGKKKRRNENLT